MSIAFDDHISVNRVQRSQNEEFVPYPVDPMTSPRHTYHIPL
ncbi:unnamed protein product [Tenebrio molitor]|nr:unnamed protein product [Tenebrio molitor]